jgi:hypothetical protein
MLPQDQTLQDFFLTYCENYNRIFGKYPVWLSRDLHTPSQWEGLVGDLLDNESLIREVLEEPTSS